jgi:hypothetical protein
LRTLSLVSKSGRQLKTKLSVRTLFLLAEFVPDTFSDQKSPFTGAGLFSRVLRCSSSVFILSLHFSVLVRSWTCKFISVNWFPAFVFQLFFSVVLVNFTARAFLGLTLL